MGPGSRIIRDDAFLDGDDGGGDREERVASDDPVALLLGTSSVAGIY